MKRILLAIAALLVSVGLIAVWFKATEKGADRRPGWQIALEDYIAYRAAEVGEQLSVVEVVPADQPSNFTKDINLLTYGGAPIPYPPVEVWCVILKQDYPKDRRSGEDTYRLVFVNLHMDALYIAEWIVHIGENTPFPLPFRQLVASLECDLDLDLNPAKKQPDWKLKDLFRKGR